jgi:hypothetical protein
LHSKEYKSKFKTLDKAGFSYSNFISREPARHELSESLRFSIRLFISIWYNNED